MDNIFLHISLQAQRGSPAARESKEKVRVKKGTSLKIKENEN
jgi:hypothetical protein